MEFTVITGSSHEHTSLYLQRACRRVYFPFPHSPISLLLFDDKLSERALGTLGLHLISHSTLNSLAGRPSSSSLPHLSIELISLVTLLDLGSIYYCPILFYFWIPFSSWLSLTAPSSDFPLLFSLSLTSPLCLSLKCWLNTRKYSGSFLGCCLSSLHSLFSLSYHFF